MVVGVLLCGPAAADTVELVTGEKIEGAILESNDDGVVMEHPVLGRLEIPADQIKPPGEAEVKPGLFGTSFLRGWTKGVSVGWNAASGKSRTQNFNADLGLSRETERNRGNLVARYFYNENDSDVENNQFDTRYIHDFLFPPSAWFPFLSSHYRFDSQQDWNHRLGADTGVGYQFIETDEWNLLGRVGGGFSQTLKDSREETTDVPVGESPRHRGNNPIRSDDSNFRSIDISFS